MAPDIVTEVQGKNCTNPEGFTMSILYRWKHIEVYFPMALNSSTFDNPAMRFEYFCKDYSRTALDFVTEVQGKNCTNPEGFTMGILYYWKRHEVYFPMASISSTLDNPAMRFEYFCKDYSRTELFRLVRSEHLVKCSNSCIFKMGLFVRPPAQL